MKKTSKKLLIQFLNAHHVMCLATQGSHGPHAAPVFYALLQKPLQLIFLSDIKARHVVEIQADPRVSLGIYGETRDIGSIQGVQIWGRAHFPPESSPFSFSYFKAHPNARFYHAMHPAHQFCVISVEKARLVDNRFGFGHRREWTLRKKLG